MYIYLISGKQLDYRLVTRILDDIVHLCRKNNIQYISLEAANNTLRDYYIKYGFEELNNLINIKILQLNLNNSRCFIKNEY